MTSFIRAIGAQIIDVTAQVGHMSLFLGAILKHFFLPPFRFGNFLKQFYFIGVRSLFVICLTAVFAGMVLGLQGYYTLARFGSEGLLGAAVALSMIRELGPVLSALMVTARAGSSLAAGLGIMRIREQIDALEAMGINPVKYLVVPRVEAGLLALPLLTAIFDVVGIMGGYLVAVQLLDMSVGTYFGQMAEKVVMRDILTGLIKSFVFGLTVTWVCTYKGYFASRGAEGVGQATTSAVVLSSVLVLVWDYFIASIMI